LPHSQGTVEMGMYGHGIVFNENYESWKYNSKFFTDAFVAQKFIDNAVKPTCKLYEELSSYWQSLRNQNNSNRNNDNWTLETDFSAWLHGFANDIASIIITGERTYSITSCYNKQSLIKSECPNALVEDGDKFIKSIMKFVESIMFFALLSPFLRHYIPIIKNKSNDLLKNRDYLFEKFDNMIKKRRREVKEMLVDIEMRTVMLTSLIMANTNMRASNDEASEDIRGNLLDVSWEEQIL
ncbi:14913_t:CDS:1, partial [Racocetra persica]